MLDFWKSVRKRSFVDTQVSDFVDVIAPVRQAASVRVTCFAGKAANRSYMD